MVERCPDKTEVVGPIPTWRTHMSSLRTLSPTFIAILALFVVGAFAAYARLSYIGVSPQGDYQGYIDAAKFIGGEQVDSVPYFRLIKPLNPLLISALHPSMGYMNAFILQSLIFYFAFIVVMYLFAYEFFEDRALSILMTLLAMLSYPILRYGIDLLIETGALFGYVLSLWLTMRFLRVPNMRIFLWNVIAITLGFLWKEYAIVNAIIFGLVILLHPDLARVTKAKYIAWFAGIFLAVHIPWQLYMFFAYHYTYIAWYAHTGTAGYGTLFTPVNIIKSTGAILGLAWLTVPAGLLKVRSLEKWKQLFLMIALPIPFMGYVWSTICSRTLYVMAPTFLLLSLMGMRSYSRTVQIAIVCAAILFNVAWLIYSHATTY